MGSKDKAPRPTELLRDLRWVYKNPKAKADTEARTKLQQMFRDEPEAFVRMLAGMEKDRRSKKVEASAGESAGKGGGGGGRIVRDEGAERVEEMIARLLEEAGGEG